MRAEGRGEGDLTHSGNTTDMLPIYPARQLSVRWRYTTILDGAERFSDPARAATARAEIDFLTAELATAYGLGRRPRKGADTNEKVRKAVTKFLRTSLARIQQRICRCGGTYTQRSRPAPSVRIRLNRRSPGRVAAARGRRLLSCRPPSPCSKNSKRLVLPKVKNSPRLTPPLDFHQAMPHTPSP